MVRKAPLVPRNKPARQTATRSCHLGKSLPASGTVPVYKDQMEHPLEEEESPVGTTCPFTIFDMSLC